MADISQKLLIIPQLIEQGTQHTVVLYYRDTYYIVPYPRENEKLCTFSPLSSSLAISKQNTVLLTRGALIYVEIFFCTRDGKHEATVRRRDEFLSDPVDSPRSGSGRRKVAVSRGRQNPADREGGLL